MDSPSPFDRRSAIQQLLYEAEARAPLVPVMGLYNSGLGALAYDAIYDAATDHCREFLGRKPSHDETMEVLAAVYASIGRPSLGGCCDLSDYFFVGWARFAAAIAFVASENIGWQRDDASLSDGVNS